GVVRRLADVLASAHDSPPLVSFLNGLPAPRFSPISYGAYARGMPIESAVFGPELRGRGLLQWGAGAGFPVGRNAPVSQSAAIFTVTRPRRGNPYPMLRE